MDNDAFFSLDMVPQTGTQELTFDIRPLSFDRIHGGHVTTSFFPVFRMPIELFSHILDYLSCSDLKALALVDRDCQQLATLYNFKEAKIQYASTKPDTTQTFQPNHFAANARCIRRITITARSRGELILPKFFLASISTTIERYLPNLHILDWDYTTTFISSTFISSLLSSPVKHLRLSGGILAEKAPSTSPNNTFPLETLCLDISFGGPPNIRRKSNLVDTLILPACSTLRQLVWKGCFQLEDVWFDISPEVSRFPNLRSLALDTVASNSHVILTLFLGANTRVATLSMDSVTESTRHFYRTRGYMTSLERFSWLHHGSLDTSRVADVLSFLQSNPQLQALHIPEPVPSWLLDQSIIPMIQSNFHALVSLHLVWAGSGVQEDSLQAISHIPTLRHLWISIGDQDLIRNTWEIDHKIIREQLSSLSYLETLAFSKDTYKTNAHPLAPRFCDYYFNKALPVDLDITSYLSPAQLALHQGQDLDYAQGIAQQIEMRHLAWEKWHAVCMLALANEYARSFRLLRWCFIGQTPMGIDPFGLFLLVHDPPQREPCLSSLQKRMSMTIWRPV